MGFKGRNVIFWNCKLYETQWATMMVILSENRKKKYPKSRDLKTRGKNICARSLTLISKIPIFILKVQLDM
jgi:hypothetical protein